MGEGQPVNGPFVSLISGLGMGLATRSRHNARLATEMSERKCFTEGSLGQAVIRV
jgi:hypothetical protein